MDIVSGPPEYVKGQEWKNRVLEHVQGGLFCLPGLGGMMAARTKGCIKGEGCCCDGLGMDSKLGMGREWTGGKK